MHVEVETRESLASHVDSLDDITPYPIRRIRTRCYTTSHEELDWRKFEIGPLYRRAVQSGATAVVAHAVRQRLPQFCTSSLTPQPETELKSTSSSSQSPLKISSIHTRNRNSFNKQRHFIRNPFWQIRKTPFEIASPFSTPVVKNGRRPRGTSVHPRGPPHLALSPTESPQ